MYPSSTEILQHHISKLSTSLLKSLENPNHSNFIQDRASKLAKTQKIAKSELETLEKILVEKRSKLTIKEIEVKSKLNQLLMELEDSLSENHRINLNQPVWKLQETYSEKREVVENHSKSLSNLIEKNKKLEEIKAYQEAQILALRQEKETFDQNCQFLIIENNELREKIHQLQDMIDGNFKCELETSARNEFLLKELNETLESVDRFEKENEELRLSIFEGEESVEYKDLVFCEICLEPEMGRMKSCIKCSIQVHARCTKDLRYMCSKCKI